MVKQTRSPRSWRSPAVLLALALAASACDSGSGAVVPDAVQAPSGASVQASTQEFARALALALEAPEVRTLLHGALSNSRYNEHKLVLQPFLQTAEGRRLANAMAAARGVDASVVSAWAAQMPRMDFYVPFAEHRRAWTGGADVVVAANLDVDESRFTGYTPAGAPLQFDARAGVPTQTVIFMHPEEVKGVRAEARRPGLRTIEDPSLPVSNVMLMSLGDECDPETALIECGGGGGGGGTLTPTTYSAKVHSFINWEGDGVGGIELMVKHYAGQGGTRIDEQIMEEGLDYTTNYGPEYDDVTYPNRPIKFALSGTTWIKVWERDSGAWEPSGDEFWGEGAFAGFGVRHRFFTGTVAQVIPTSSPCYNYHYTTPNCTDPTVDIVYAQQ